jgi:menaquinone-dependent protoporphyrinogen oxidase
MTTKPVLVLYATREGHTALVAERIAKALRARQLDANVENVGAIGEAFDPTAHSGVVVAASVHLAKHEREMIDFCHAHRLALVALPTAFVSVSMSAALAGLPAATDEQRADARGRAQVAIDEFLDETGWEPGSVEMIGGAMPYTKFGLATRLFLRSIVGHFGGPTDTKRDYVFTDDKSIEALADGLKERITDRASLPPRNPGIILGE